MQDRSSRVPTAWRSWMTPTFMSKQPGRAAVPFARSREKCQRVSVPSGQTVSTCPISATDRRPGPAGHGQCKVLSPGDRDGLARFTDDVGSDAGEDTSTSPEGLEILGPRLGPHEGGQMLDHVVGSTRRVARRALMGSVDRMRSIMTIRAAGREKTFGMRHRAAAVTPCGEHPRS